MPPGVVNYHGDGNVCVHNRHIYIENSCKFAPVEVAVKFSQELSHFSGKITNPSDCINKQCEV